MLATDDERREVARKLRETGEELGSAALLWYHIAKALGVRAATDGKTACGMLADLIEPGGRRRADEWRDFATDPPSDKKPVLCKSANGKVYVGNPCFFANDTFTGKVWVPRGDRYRKPAKWMEIDDD